MASLLGALLQFLRILRSLAKDHIKRFPRSCWALLLAYLGRKLSKWWYSWFSKSGAHGNTKPTYPSFPGGRGGTCSVSCRSSARRGYAARVAASTVPASANAANRRSRDGAEWQPETLPLSPISATSPASPADPQWGPSPDLGERGPTNHSSGNLSIQSTGDGPSISRSSSRASNQNDPPLRGPRATHRQFGSGGSRGRSSRSSSRGQSSRSPSPRPSLTNPQFFTRLPFPSSHTREHISSPAVHPAKQRTTSINLDIQNPSTESLPDTSSIDAQAQEHTEALVETSTRSPRTSLADEWETASRHSHTASSTSLNHFVLPELEGRILQLINSDQIPRYTKNIATPREERLRFVEPLTTTFPYFPEPNGPDQESPRQGCGPWIPATHPDGALYFYDPVRRLFTDTDMHEQGLKEEMGKFYSYLQDTVRIDGLTIPSKNYDLVLDLMKNDDNEMQWSYYYACHDTRCLFWLERYDTTYVTSEVDGVESPAHLKHLLEEYYWNHWSLFPVIFEGRSLPLGVYDELMGILAHGCIDVMTSRTSTSPYDNDQMQKMIEIVHKAKEAQPGVGHHGMEHHIAATTRLLSFFAHWRFLYFHGQRHAWLISDQAMFTTQKRGRSGLILFLSPFLFFTPEAHLMEMEKLWTGEVIIERAWKSFISKTIIEWNDLILWSTVTLALNVGFLSIPGIVPYSIPNGTLSMPRQMTILSLLVSIGSILIGLLLVRHNRTKQDVEPTEAWDYFFQNSRRYFGLDLVAVVFSLPWALLIWSMLLFLIAVITYSWSVSNLWSRIAMGSISALVFSLLVGCMWTIWESSNGLGVWLDSLRLLVSQVRIARLRDGILSFRNRFHPVTTDNGNEPELASPRDSTSVIGSTV